MERMSVSSSPDPQQMQSAHQLRVVFRRARQRDFADDDFLIDDADCDRGLIGKQLHDRFRERAEAAMDERMPWGV